VRLPSRASGGQNDSTTAVAVASAVRRAIDALPQREIARVLFGVSPSTEGWSLGARRAAAAERALIKPDSFRLRREPRLLRDLSHALLVELAAPERPREDPVVSETGGNAGDHAAEFDPQSTRAYLRILSGGAYREIMLAPFHREVTIGRAPGSGVHIDDPQVSRQHAVLERHHQCWFIRDVSTNGTIVDSKTGIDVQPLRKGERQRLHTGSEIRLGSTLLSFHELSRSDVSTAIGCRTASFTPSPTERAVLLDLVRPWLQARSGVPVPPSDSEIAESLGWTVGRVRAAIRSLYKKAGITLEQPAPMRRMELVRHALVENLVSRDRDK
jgi:FHA domain-containing protein